MNKSTRFPPLNSFRFIPANEVLAGRYNTWSFDRGLFFQHIKDYFQMRTNYAQKVLPDDQNAVYLDSLATECGVSLYDEYGNLVSPLVGSSGGTLTLPGYTDSVFGDQYTTFAFKFAFSDFDIPDGFYYVVTNVVYDGDDDLNHGNLFVSEPIQIRSTWKRTMLLEYQNNSNGYDVLWYYAAVPRPWSFRVEATIDIDPTFHDTSFEDQAYRAEKLQSIPYRIGNLIIGGEKGVPPWVLDKVNRILACDTVLIDGVEWKKEPGANWTFTSAPGSALKAGAIKLRDNPAIPEWEFNNADSGAGAFRVHSDEYDDVYA